MKPCRESLRRHKHNKIMVGRHMRFKAIGTAWKLQIDDAVSKRAWQSAEEQVQACIARFDALFSRFRDDSLVTAMSRQAGTYDLPPDGYRLLQFYEKLYKLTDGKFTPLIGQVMAEAGYDSRYSLRPGELHEVPAWEDVITYTPDTITLARPALLDFGAAGKGYLVDLVGEVLQTAGVTSYIIDAGGDIRHRSARSEAAAAALENPFDTAEAIGTVSLLNQSLCASAGSKRAWARYHHIFDPDTLNSVQTVAATWVMAGDTLTADGLATALFFCEPRTLLREFRFGYAKLAADKSLEYSKNFPVKFFETESHGKD